MFGGKSLPAKIFGAPYYLSRDLIRPHICRFLQARSGHLLAVEINSWVGLFAHLEWFLEISLHCERNDLIPCFMSTSPQYVDPARGPDLRAKPRARVPLESARSTLAFHRMLPRTNRDSATRILQEAGKRTQAFFP